MNRGELAHVVAAVLVLFVVVGLGFIVVGDVSGLSLVFAYSVIVILVPVLVKKGAAHLLDVTVEHEVWLLYRFGFLPGAHFKKPVPFGLIVPLAVSFLTLGIVQVMTFLTYEARALKHRAAKRFGPYSFKNVTDWHHGLIGAAGVISLLLVSMISYFLGWELLTEMTAYYAFWSTIPFSKLDGAQIFFGHRVLWAVLFLISLMFGLFGLLVL